MTTQHVLILGSGAAGAAATRTLASRDDVRVTLVTRTGETPYTRMLIKGIAFGPTPPEMIKLPLPQIEVIADTVLERRERWGLTNWVVPVGRADDFAPVVARLAGT